MEKVCNDKNCEIEGPQDISNFGPSVNHKSGINNKCRKCVARKSRKWRASDSGKIKSAAAVKRYAESNKDVSAAKSARYREHHPDKIKQYSKKYYQENKEVILARHKEDDYKQGAALRQKRYRAADPLKHRTSWKAWASSDAGKAWRRAYQQTKTMRRKGLFVESVRRDILFTRDQETCQRCFTKLDYYGQWHMDHVWPTSRGGLHCYANVQVLCAACNLQKHASLPDTWEMLKVYKRMLSNSSSC